jgi:hypothetical protein
MRMKVAIVLALLTFPLLFAGRAFCISESEHQDPGNGEVATSLETTPSGSPMAANYLNLPSQPETVSNDPVDFKAESTPAEPADPASHAPGQPHYSHIGIGVKVSTLGAGIEVATPLTRRLNVRGGFNMMRLDHTFTDSGIQYSGQLRFQSAEAHLDWFPFWGFHVSPGVLFYNGNHINAIAMVPGGQTFSVSGTTYESDPTAPVTGTGKLDFVKVAPSLMLGVGNLIPRSGRHFSFLFEVGAAYEGSARVSLNLTGNVCDTSGLVCRAISSDPTVQANVQGEQVKIQHDVNPYRFFPVVSLGVGFNF